VQKNRRRKRTKTASDSEPGDTLAASVDDPHHAHVIARALEVAGEAHAFRDLVSETPEIDDVATGAQ
jgi:hypothetical protein